MTQWYLDSSTFYIYLEDRLRKIVESYNSKSLKPLYKVSVKIAVTSPSILPDCSTYKINKGDFFTAVSVTLLIEFLLVVVSTSETIYEVDFVSVYFKTGQNKKNVRRRKILCR